MDFCSYLESIGFKPFRNINNKYVPCTSDMSFSTMQSGMLYVYYLRNEDTFLWGLNEFGKPPTLISPRPTILLHTQDDRILSPVSDDYMNRLLQTTEPKELYESIFNGTIYNFDIDSETQRKYVF
jgi:hypothetical protein